MTDVLAYQLEVSSLCPPGPLSRFEKAGECIGIDFDWQSLGPDRRAVEGVLRQWNGAKVTLEGLLEIKELSRREAREYGTRFWKRISEVSFVEILDLPPSTAYCLGYKGPRLPSPYEKTLREFEDSKRSSLGERCQDDTWAVHAEVKCVDAIKPIVWLRGQRTAPFHPPVPFANRDIKYFQALSASLYLFTLSNDRLYAWTGSESVEVQSPEVDLLSFCRDGWVYYRSTERGEDGEFLSNSLQRVNERLERETLWQSTEVRLEGIMFFEPFGIRVRRGETLQDLTYDWDTRSWKEAEAGD